MKTPVLIHRALLGSVERMLAMLAEHYAGRCTSSCFTCKTEKECLLDQLDAASLAGGHYGSVPVKFVCVR